jgi:hypothetical protein
VFATDLETKELAEELGLTVFYDERVSWIDETDGERVSVILDSHVFLFLIMLEFWRNAQGSCWKLWG